MKTKGKYKNGYKSRGNKDFFEGFEFHIFLPKYISGKIYGQMDKYGQRTE